MEENATPAYLSSVSSARNDELMRDCERVSSLLNRLNFFMVVSSQSPEWNDRTSQIKVAAAAVISAGITLLSILKLNKKLSLQVRDALILSRVFYETSLNCCFTCADNGERAKRAESYAIVQAYQSQKKFRRIGSTTALFENDRGILKSDPRVAEAMKEFRKQNGKFEKNCFRENRDEMIAMITQEIPHAGIFLSAVEGMLFDISSELAHGSYFGFLESPIRGQCSNVEALEGDAELVGFTVLLSASSIAYAVARLLRDNDISNEIAEIADKYFRSLAQEEGLPSPMDASQAKIY